ncbi:MAG: hypothetical protein QM523_02635 [Candidatus Pacebacteria bacterium]|nr:hypothetical protein [Candidatus Paceibacterota bacterium]
MTNIRINLRHKKDKLARNTAIVTIFTFMLINLTSCSKGGCDINTSGDSKVLDTNCSTTTTTIIPPLTLPGVPK